MSRSLDTCSRSSFKIAVTLVLEVPARFAISACVISCLRTISFNRLSRACWTCHSCAAAKEWQVQHALLKRLKEIVRKQEITHAEIAKRAGTSRTRVTAILNDDLEHVSSDLLIRLLATLGYRVKVSVVRSDQAA